MRCLAATGLMHNRMRMMVAQFLTKDLLVDWRRGERYPKARDRAVAACRTAGNGP